jgi:hypothetical protein
MATNSCVHLFIVTKMFLFTILLAKDIIEEFMTILNRHTVSQCTEGIPIKLALFAHLVNIFLSKYKLQG